MLSRAEAIQETTMQLMERAEHSIEDMMDSIVAAKKHGVADEKLGEALQLHRKGMAVLEEGIGGVASCTRIDA